MLILYGKYMYSSPKNQPSFGFEVLKYRVLFTHLSSNRQQVDKNADLKCVKSGIIPGC